MKNETKPQTPESDEAFDASKESMDFYFEHFRVALELKDATAQQYALDLANKANRIYQGDEPRPDGFPAALADAVRGWCFETIVDGSDIVLLSEDGGVGAACAFIQHLLQKFDANGYVAFEWSRDCPPPCRDSYGGGAAIITAHEIKTMDTSEWLSQMLSDHSQSPS